LKRFNIRNHRKLLVWERARAFVGGYNISNEWIGDGVERGWRDVGVVVGGMLAVALAESFDRMFELAGYQHQRLRRLRRRRVNYSVRTDQGTLLAAGPGRGRHPIRGALLNDLKTGRNIDIIAAYFLPPGRFLRVLQRAASVQGNVRLILPARTDVVLLQAASRGFYGRLLRSKVQIFEYQPQVLHSKLVIVDDAVYVGSANLERRSLEVNYELLLRLQGDGVAARAREVFEDYLRHCIQVTRQEWRSRRTLWQKLLQRFAGMFFGRIDPLITRYQLRSFR
jgi:cardiolipin synthase